MEFEEWWEREGWSETHTFSKYAASKAWEAALNQKDERYYTKDWKDEMIQDQGLEE